MRCLSCKYDLRNLPENRCPECGRVFDPSDSRTWLPPPRRKTIALLTLALCAVPVSIWLLFQLQSRMQMEGRRGFESVQIVMEVIGVVWLACLGYLVWIFRRR